MTSKWNKESSGSVDIVWRNVKDPSITVEAHFDEGDDSEPFWYAFTAKNGRGQESSPHIEDTRREIISVIARLKEDFEN